MSNLKLKPTYKNSPFQQMATKILTPRADNRQGEMFCIKLLANGVDELLSSVQGTGHPTLTDDEISSMRKYCRDWITLIVEKEREK